MTSKFVQVGTEASGRRELSRFERIVAVAGFPISLVATFAVTIALIERGVAPGLAIAPSVAGFYLALAITERLIPWHRSWLGSKGDVGTDIGLYLTNTVAVFVVSPALLAAGVMASAWLSTEIGLGFWPTTAPLLAQVALALLVGELWEYSWHRAMHEVPWLWRFHATHHSAPRLYWLNAIRFHPIDVFLIGTLKLVPLAILGAGAPVLALVNLFSAVHGSYQHANVPVRLGPLNWIFSMAELHRWHHSPVVAEANHNYGGNLIVWDVLFGTRWLPTDREPPEAIGIQDMPSFPMGFWANLVAPFRWRAVTEESGALRVDERAAVAPLRTPSRPPRDSPARM